MDKENKEIEMEQEQVVDAEDTIIVHSIEDDIKAIGASNEVDSDSSETDGNHEPEVVQQEARKPRAKKRIQELSKKNKELERELTELREAQSTGTSQGNDNSSDAIAPDIDDYDSFDDYDKALTEFNSNKSVDTKEEISREVEVFENLDILLDDAKDKFPDFDEVVQNPDLVITLDLMESLAQFEDGAGDMLYTLASDVELLAEFVALTPKQQYKRLVLLENDINKGVVRQAKIKRGSNAPEPISPVGGKGNRVLSLDDDDLTYEEHEALSNARASTTKGGWL